MNERLNVGEKAPIAPVENTAESLESVILIPKPVSEEAYVKEDELQQHPEVSRILQGGSTISLDRKLVSYAFSRCRALLVINTDNGATFFQHLGPTHMEAFMGDHRARGANLSGLFTLFTEQAKRHDSTLKVISIAGDQSGWGVDVPAEVGQILTEAGINHTVLPEIKVPSGDKYDWALNYDPKTGQLVIRRIVEDGDTKEAVYEEYAVPDVAYPEFSNSRADMNADLEELKVTYKLVGDIDDLFTYGMTSRMNSPDRKISDFPDLVKTLVERVWTKPDDIMYPKEKLVKDVKRWNDWWSSRTMEWYSKRQEDKIRRVIPVEDAEALIYMLGIFCSIELESSGEGSVNDVPGEVESKIYKLYHSLNNQSLFIMYQAWNKLFTTEEPFSEFTVAKDISGLQELAEREKAYWEANPIERRT